MDKVKKALFFAGAVVLTIVAVRFVKRWLPAGIQGFLP